ncbi:unnamed protein product [Trichobilharzia szidati]|nr:unnamed protein product [Trichobilharzia szidati]
MRELVVEVALYDNRFVMMWERPLYRIREEEFMTDPKSTSVSLSVVPTCGLVYPRQCGVVFVGFPTNTIHDDHYSTISLSLEDGMVFWYHLAGDFEGSSRKFHDLISKNWKLSLSKQFQFSTHGESPWIEYRGCLSQVLPVRWFGMYSSEIHLVYAAKDSRYDFGGRLPDPNAIAVIHPLGLDLLDSKSGRPLTTIALKWKVGSVYAILSTSASNNFIHWKLGLPTIYEIRVSSQITEYPSSGLRVKIHHASDETKASLESDFSHTIDCQGLFIRYEYSSNNWELDKSVYSNSLFEVHSSTFHGLCRPFKLWEYARLGRSDWQEDERKSLPPIVVKRHSEISSLAGLWHSLLNNKGGEFDLHIRNQRLTYLNEHEYHDIFFLTSDGTITSVSNHGHENWRVNSDVSWLQVSRTLRNFESPGGERSVDRNLSDLYIKHFHPALIAVDLTPLGTVYMRNLNMFPQSKPVVSVMPLIVSVGWDSVSIVDRSNGKFLATHRLPTQPTGQPIAVPLVLHNATKPLEVVYALSLLLVPCNDLIVGFVVVQSLRVWILLPLIVSLVISFSVLTLCCDLDARNTGST